MVLADFENLLKETMGLDVASIGSSAIERAVEKRLLACELQETHAYWERVRVSEAELQELIEAVVVPETWFFRDREAFAALALTVYEDWLGAHPEDHLRLLSLPSSTGEEPYSMAMALLDAGFPANRFRVDAVDISARALARAGHAVYGKNSFRGNELGFRDRHFEATAHGYRLSDAVRRQVRFQQSNLLAAGFFLPQCADLLRPRRAGPRPHRAGASADAERCFVRRPIGDRLAAGSQLHPNKYAAGVRLSQSGRHSARTEAERRPSGQALFGPAPGCTAGAGALPHTRASRDRVRRDPDTPINRPGRRTGGWH